MSRSKPKKIELDLDDIAELTGPGASQGNGEAVTIELRVVPAAGYNTRRPDVDSLLKLVMDVLQGEGALGELDDCAFVEVSPRKLRSQP